MVKTVLIVGGGAFGAKIAHSLSMCLSPERHKLILVSSRRFYIHMPATLRMLVTSQDSLEQSAFIPYDKLFVKGNGEFVEGIITEINRNESGLGGNVTVGSTAVIDWDVLILAPGMQWEGSIDFPLDLQEAEDHVEEWRQLIQQSQNIVLVGGGPAGIELAGELRDVYSRKRITIVHSGHHLLNDRYPLDFRRSMQRDLASRGVRLVLSNNVDKMNEDGRAVATREGNIIDSDLIIPTRGGIPNTHFVRSLGDDALDSDGYIRVNSTLQLFDHTDIFAAGDATDLKEEKQLSKAAAHANVIVENVLAVLDGRIAKKVYVSPSESLVLSNGRKRGKAYFDVLWGITLGKWYARRKKSKSLSLPKARALFGVRS